MYNNNVVLIDFTSVFISCMLRTLKVASVNKRGTLWHAHARSGTHISVGPRHNIGSSSLSVKKKEGSCSEDGRITSPGVHCHSASDWANCSWEHVE